MREEQVLLWPQIYAFGQATLRFLAFREIQVSKHLYLFRICNQRSDLVTDHEPKFFEFQIFPVTLHQRLR